MQIKQSVNDYLPVVWLLLKRNLKINSKCIMTTIFVKKKKSFMRFAIKIYIICWNQKVFTLNIIYYLNDLFMILFCFIFWETVVSDITQCLLQPANLKSQHYKITIIFKTFEWHWYQYFKTILIVEMLILSRDWFCTVHINIWQEYIFCSVCVQSFKKLYNNNTPTIWIAVKKL